MFIHLSVVVGNPYHWQYITGAGLQISCSRAESDRLIHSANSLIKHTLSLKTPLTNNTHNRALTPYQPWKPTSKPSHSSLQLQGLVSIPVRVHWTVMWGVQQMNAPSDKLIILCAGSLIYNQPDNDLYKCGILTWQYKLFDNILLYTRNHENTKVKEE